MMSGLSLMTKSLTLLMFICLAFWSCASTSDDALRQQENFIKNHPTWEGHPLNFEKRKPELNALEIIEKINKEKKMDAKIDSIILNQSKH